MITVDAALEAERRELQTRLREALEELPEEQRDAVTLTHIAGLTVRDAASSLGVSSSTVDRRVQEGLTELRKKLDKKPALLSAALFALHVQNPPQGMNAALKSWLGAVHGSAVLGTTTGVSTMKIAIFAALGFVILACAAGGCFWHFHHDQASEHLQQMHEFFRALHGK